MTYKFEDKDGVRTYTVNGKVYEKLEDVPSEFQSFFKDENQNRIPDQMEEMLDGVSGSIAGKDIFKALWNQRKSIKFDDSPTRTQPLKNQSEYDRMDKGGLSILTLLKISIGIFIVLAAIYLGVKFSSKNDAFDNSTGELSNQNGAPLRVTPLANRMFFRIQDPNEPPYKMFVEAAIQDEVIFTFDMPDGELNDSNDDHIAVSQEGEGNTNVLKQIFNIIASNSDCDLTSNESRGLQWKKIRVGNNDFYQGIEDSQIAGNAASVYSYVLSKDGHCITFMLEIVYDTPTEFQQAFDKQEKILQLERLLLSIKYSSENN